MWHLWDKNVVRIELAVVCLKEADSEVHVHEAGSLFDDAPSSQPPAPPVDHRALARSFGVPSVVEASFPRRVKAMLPTAPIHRLAEITGWRDWSDAGYDPRVLAVAAVDAVIARQGLVTGMTYDDLVLALAELANLAVPGRNDDEYFDVARYVTDGLLNNRDDNDGQAFRYRYSDYTGGHTAREFGFHLLVERTKADGSIVLEASTEAVNALRGGLDLRVEDAQEAMRHILAVQIAQGRLDDAELSAEHNQRLSLELAGQIRDLLDATRADVARVDWAGDVTARLASARSHVERCIEADGELAAHLAREDVGDAATAETAGRIVELLEAALHQHRGLHNQLIVAPRVFLEEQQRQELNRRGHALWRTSVRRGLLEPLSARNAGVARPLLEAFLVAELGVVPPRLPQLGRLFDKLLEQRTRETIEPAVDEDVDIDELPDEPDVFDAVEIGAARTLLASCRTAPRRFSELLADAELESSSVEELVRLSVLWCYGAEHDDEPALASELIDDDMVAVPVGESFAAGRWHGDELLVGTVAALADVLDDVDDRYDLDTVDRVPVLVLPGRVGPASARRA